MLFPKLFLLACVSFISLVSSDEQSDELLPETHQTFVDDSEIPLHRRREIVDKYLNTLPSSKDWVDPYDMFGPAVNQPKVEKPIEDHHLGSNFVMIDTNKVTVNDGKDTTHFEANEVKEPIMTKAESSETNAIPTTDSSSTEDYLPKTPCFQTDRKQDATDTKKPETVSSNAATEASVIRLSAQELKGFCALDSVYVTRWIKRLLYRIEKEAYNESSAVSFSIDATTLESLKELSNSKLFEMSTFDDVIGNLLSQATVTTREPFTWYRTLVYYYDLLKIILYSLGLCAVVYVVLSCFVTHPVKTTIFSIIVISVCWHWKHLYEKEVAIHQAELASMQIPTQCRKHDLGLMEHINEYFKSFFATNDCSKYYEALLVDPFWKVSVTMAISEAFAAFVFQPLFAGSRAINACIKQLFDGLPIHLAVALIVFIFMLALIMGKYSVKFFWFAGIEPSAHSISGSRVEEVPPPTLMQNVTRAARNAISENQSPSMETLQNDTSTGISERSKPSTARKAIKNTEASTGVSGRSKPSTAEKAIKDYAHKYSSDEDIGIESNMKNTSPSKISKPSTAKKAIKHDAYSSEDDTGFESNTKNTSPSKISKPSTSKSNKHDAKQYNSADDLGVASNMKNHEASHASPSGCFDVKKSAEPEYNKLKVDLTKEKSPEEGRSSAMPSETNPKRLAIEDTFNDDTLPSLVARSTFPRSDEKKSLPKPSESSPNTFDIAETSNMEASSSSDATSSTKSSIDARDQNSKNAMKEVSNLQSTLSDSFEVLPIPGDEDEMLLSFGSAGPNCDTSMDMLQEMHRGCRYCQPNAE